MNTKKEITAREEAARLYDLFREYRNAYAGEWERLNKCERIYRGEHWYGAADGDANEPRPVTPVIQSTIENVRADLIDQTPEAVILADDVKYAELAETLNAVIGENHRRQRFDREYASMLHDLLVGGYMVQETGFDATLYNGLGGAYIRHVDSHGIMFDPLAANIQDSRAIFKFTEYPREWFADRYPKLADEFVEDECSFLRQTDGFIAKPDGDTMLLIECWRREYDERANRHRVHMIKLAGGVIVEDSRKAKPDGYYAHGEYPFVVTPLFMRKGTALGFGFVDMFETQQLYSDKLDQIVMKNALMASHNKLLITGASGFDPEDLRDWSKEVHRGESLSGVTWFPTAPLPAYIIGYVERIRASIKEESGANDFSRGTTTGGVTAASAIAALQEAGSKRSRMAARAVHGAFEEAVRQEIEVEREYAVFPREVYVKGANELRRFTGEAMYATSELGNVLPLEFAVSVKSQRENRFSVAAHNELILKLVQTGMVAPEVGLSMMIFDGKEEAVAKMAARAAE